MLQVVELFDLDLITMPSSPPKWFKVHRRLQVWASTTRIMALTTSVAVAIGMVAMVLVLMFVGDCW